MKREDFSFKILEENLTKKKFTDVCSVKIMYFAFKLFIKIYSVSVKFLHLLLTFIYFLVKIQMAKN
jgi:hypothetical protein